MTENIEYRAEFNIEDFVDKYVERVNREIDQRVLDKVEHRLAEYGYVKVVRCRDCKYYDGEPDMESLGEKCWRDPDHTGHSAPTIANGFCYRAKRKEVGE